MAAPVPNQPTHQRRRGAQPGNRNARKPDLVPHRMGSGYVPPYDLRDLTSVREEIFQVRKFFRYLLKIMPAAMDYNSALYAIRTLNDMTITLCRLFSIELKLISERRDAESAMGYLDAGYEEEDGNFLDILEHNADTLAEKFKENVNAAPMPPSYRDDFIRRLDSVNRIVKSIFPEEAARDAEENEGNIPNPS